MMASTVKNGIDRLRKGNERRGQQKRHLKMQLLVSAIISTLFKVITLAKCVPGIKLEPALER